jgi:CheY-like chemotaxis protein
MQPSGGLPVRSTLFLAFVLTLCAVSADSDEAQAQEQPKDVPKPLVLYSQFRELMTDGKYDIAANFLQAFLDANPTEQNLLDLEKKYGTTTFTGLRTVPKWSDDPKVDKKTRENVEEIVKLARAASEKLLRDPARVQKYIRNLGATYEERGFAELELRRTGDYAIPYMVEEFAITRDKDVYSGILGAIAKLDAHTMSGWVAALDILTPEQQYGVITAIAKRPDILNLLADAQTDLTPVLWRIMAMPAEQAPTLRAAAEEILNQLYPKTKSASKLPQAELVNIARTFYDHTARYAQPKKNGDGSPTTVPLWVADTKNPERRTVARIEDVPVGQADEYYGLRYARWALEAKPDYEPAQGMIISIAAERAIERAKYGNLAKSEPAVYKLLSDAPSAVLNEQLNRGLNQKKTALVLAMLQVLGDRGDRDAATPPAGTPPKPSLLAKALTYPDPQVQITAANALLRSPVPVPPELRGLIVDILRRAAAADPGVPANAKGSALLADPNKQRADSIAVLLRGLGYDVEVFTTGRDLLRRVGHASDFDVILIDHHSANPELIDLIGQLQADAKTGNRPTFVVASTDKPRLPTYDQLLVKFSALIAATENEIVLMPPLYVPDIRDTPEKINDGRKATAEKRDGTFRLTAANRMARMNRVIDSTGINLTDAQKLLLQLRLELITYAVLGAEFTISPESSPETVKRIAQLRRQIALQPPSKPYGVGLPTTDMLKLIERFEIDLGRVPAAKKRFEELYAKIDPVDLGLPVETFRDPVLEAKIGRTLQNYPSVRIIPEPFGRTTLAADLGAVQAEPGQAPRDQAEKKAAQKIAVEWLRKMATGELTGFDVKSAEGELRAALRIDDIAEAAIEALSKFGSADTQQALLSLAVNAMRPLPIRSKAADAGVRHIQANGKLVPKNISDEIADAATKEPDVALRGKLLTLKGMLAHNSGTFLNDLKGYTPPLIPGALPKLPPKEKEPEPKPKEPDAKP